MKNIGFKRIFVLTVVLFLMIATPACSQSVIYTHLGSNSEYSKIRHYRNDVDIRYEFFTLNPYGARAFYYVDRSSGLVFSFTLPLYYDIADFEIYNDNVYFCGSNNTDPYWGYFNIDSVFFYSGDVHFAMINLPVNNNGAAYIDVPLNLDVFEESGKIHVVMVGSGYENYTYCGYIAEAWQASLGWSFQYTMDTSHTVLYKDVAVTDSYVVVLGGTYTSISYPAIGSLKHRILYYDRPTGSATQSIFEYAAGTFPATSVNVPARVTDNSIFSPIPTGMHIIHTKSDGFATVCTDSDYDCVISFYQDPVYDPYERVEFSDGPVYIAEIAFNPIANSLGLLNSVSGVYRKVPLTPSIEKSWTEDYLWTSIDRVNGNNDFILSGSVWNPNLAVQWLFDPFNTNECVQNTELDVFELDTKQEELNLLQAIRPSNITCDDYHVTIDKTNIIVECE